MPGSDLGEWTSRPGGVVALHSRSHPVLSNGAVGWLRRAGLPRLGDGFALLYSYPLNLILYMRLNIENMYFVYTIKQWRLN